MGATAKAGGNLYRESRHALRALCPQPLLNWREARFYGRYGEVELHLLEYLCRRDADAIDVGANDGSYVHYMRRYAGHVFAYEPMPSLAQACERNSRGGSPSRPWRSPNRSGTVELRSPVVDGVVVTGCSTISDEAAATYPGHRGVEVPMDRLDHVYRGNAGFIKIDVEGHEQAVLDGAVETIRRCRPRMLVEIDDRLSPGGSSAPAATSPISAIAASSYTTAISSRSSSSRSTACSIRPTCPISPRRCRRASASAATSTISSSCRRRSRK